MYIANFNYIYYLIVFLIGLLVGSAIITYKFNKFAQVIAFIIILLLTIYSKSSWCYVIIILYIAIKSGLINEDICTQLNELKQAWNGNYRGSKMSLNEIESEYKKKIDEVTNYKKNIEENINKEKFIEKYKSSISDIVNWFNINRNLSFELNKKVIYNNSTPIYPDGLYQTDTRDYLLEVKYCPENTNNSQLLKKGMEQLIKMKDFYKYSNKNLEFYLALIVNSDNNLDKLKKQIENSAFSEEFHIHIFEDENNGNYKLLFPSS